MPVVNGFCFIRGPARVNSDKRHDPNRDKRQSPLAKLQQ